MLNLTHLNKEQREAVEHDAGPLLIVAGAGTGKTTVLTNRVAWLIDEKKAAADNILCLTFTDKAAGEMEERIDNLLPYGYVDLWVMTFHAFCERVLRSHGLSIGIAQDFKLLDSTSQWMLVSQHIDTFDLDVYKPLGNPTKFISSMLTHFSRAKDEGILPEQYLDYVQELELNADSAEFLQFGEKVKSDDPDEIKELWTQEIARLKELSQAYHTYQQLLHEENALDFGDLILYTKKLFDERKNVLQEYKQQFKHILVDEFQDTNWIQYELVKLLVGDEQNVTVVGDDDQSIYKFRGASLSNILGFKQDFPNCHQVVLTENYRSTQKILDLSHQFIQHNNPSRLEAQHHEGFDPINKRLKSQKEEEGLVEHLHYESLQDEAHGVVQRMISLRQNAKNLDWGDFAILVRANSSAEPFLQALTLAEIPYQFIASQGLFAKPVIMDILSYFSVLDNYAESASVYRLLILPTVDLDNTDLMRLLHHARKKSLSLLGAIKQASIAGLSEEGQRKANKVLTLIEEHSYESRTKRVSEIAMLFMDAFGLKQYYEKLDPLQQKEVYGFLNAFWRMMQTFETEQSDKRVQNFLRYLDLAKQAGDSGSLPQDLEFGPDTVKVMTIHASKGLEFEHVFVANLVDRRFPTQEKRDALPLPSGLVQEAHGTSHLEEERRLCYVALTRAKTGLYLTSARDYGGARPKKLSRFLLELGFEKTDPLELEQRGEWGQMQSSFEVKKAREIDYKQYLPKTFSYSQLKVFQTCPWQYRYAFILKIPVQGRHSFSFGKSMHSALQHFFNQLIEARDSKQADLFGSQDTGVPGEAPSLDDLLELYKKSWIDDWYLGPEHKEKYYKQGKDILRAFYKKHADDWPKTEQTEKGFTLKIGDYTLRGSIDRVDKGEQGLQLIDYKTGKVPKRDSDIDKDQLLLYQIAAEEVMGEEVEELTYYYLTELEEKSFIGNDKQKEKLKEKVQGILDTLTEAEFEPKPSKQVCKYCDYKDICQFRIL